MASDPPPESQGPWAQLCPLVDGASAADARRFAEAATGFMTELFADPRVMALQTSWRAGMKVLWLRIAKALVRDGDADLEQVRVPRRIDAHCEQAVRFVQEELRMPWPWVALALLEDCGLDVFTDLTAQTFPDRTFHAREIVGAPPLHLAPIPGESMEEQFERLAEAWRRSEAAGRAVLAEASQDQRRGPKKKAERLQDFGRWVYETEYRTRKRSRHALGKELPAHLAKRHTAGCGCYKIISAGITEARRLFALCAVTWDTLRPPVPPGQVKHRRRATASQATQRGTLARQPKWPRRK